jgi:hypothetical protein
MRGAVSKEGASKPATSRRRVAWRLALLVVLGAVIHAEGGEWGGLKTGVSTERDAVALFGPPISEYPDYLLFRGDRVKSGLNPDTIVVNLTAAKRIESLIIFPRWGVTDEEVRKEFGAGTLVSYGEFLQKTGRTRFGGGTRADQKLHYLQPDDRCELYERLGILVVYDARDLASGNEVVKLILVY